MANIQINVKDALPDLYETFEQPLSSVGIYIDGDLVEYATPTLSSEMLDFAGDSEFQESYQSGEYSVMPDFAVLETDPESGKPLRTRLYYLNFNRIETNHFV